MAGEKPELKIAVCELSSTDNIEANSVQIFTLLSGFYEWESVDLVCFPENCLFMRLDDNDPVEVIDVKHACIERLRNFAVEKQTCLFLGSVPTKINDSVFNSTMIINSDGNCICPYQKIHLFDVVLDNEKKICESNAFSHGKEPFVWEFKGWKVGLSICYDVRFGELYNYYAKREVDMIMIPSAFTVPTGRAHWQVLLQARAIECQAYVVAPAQGGIHQGLGDKSRKTWGHSMVVDPWGEVLVEVEESPDLVTCNLDPERVAKVRRQIPIGLHRRL